MQVKEGKWKDAFANVGELVLLYTALDHQLNLIVIEVMYLAPAPMLEAVVATLDPRQKNRNAKEPCGAPQTTGLEKGHQDACGSIGARKTLSVILRWFRARQTGDLSLRQRQRPNC
jgi:hypothetical protein